MNKILEYLEENDYMLKDMVQEINSWDGYFDDLCCYENGEDFFKTFFQGREIEVARAVCYGNYNYTDDYVYFNAYGNLESCNEWEYTATIKDRKEEIANYFIELYRDNKVDTYDSELEELIDEYLESEVE